MVGLVLALITVVVVVLGVAAIIMFFDLTFGDGERIVEDREQAERRWRPPYVRGAELMSWTRSMTARIVGMVLRDGADATTPKKLAVKLNDGASRAMLPLASRLDSDREVACPETGQGVIGVSVPEAIELADYLRRSLPKSEVLRVHQRSRENADLIAQDPSLRGSGSPCSLQGGDCVCRAYPARPFGCRPLHAVTIAHELGLDAVPDDGEPADWATYADAIGQGIAEGLARGLESAGLDGKIYELHSALVTALDNPDAAERWAKGEDVFGHCRLHQPGPHNGLSLVL